MPEDSARQNVEADQAPHGGIIMRFLSAMGLFLAFLLAWVIVNGI